MKTILYHLLEFVLFEGNHEHNPYIGDLSKQIQNIEEWYFDVLAIPEEIVSAVDER